MGESIAETIRIGYLEDIKQDIKDIEFFRKLDEKHFYDTNWKPFNDIIKLLSERLYNKIKDYELRYSVRISKTLLKRYVEA